MLTVNNEVLKLTDDTPVAKWAKKKMNEVNKVLKANGGFVRFRYPPSKIKPNKDVEIIEGGKAEKPSITTIPLADVLVDEERGMETWKYSKATGSGVSPEWKIDFNGNLILYKADKELIFFLMFISSMIGQGKAIEIEDKAADADAVAEKASMEADVIQYIYGKSDVNTEKNLRSIAKALYINDVDLIQNVNIIRGAIKQAVEVSDSQKQYFLQLVKNKKLVELKSTIQQAIDNHVIAFDNASCKWVYPDKGHTILELMVHQAGDKMKHLEDFLQNSEKEYEFIKKSIKGAAVPKDEGESEPPEDDGRDETDKDDSSELAELYDEAGITNDDNGLAKSQKLAKLAKSMGIDSSGKVKILEQRILKAKQK